MDKLSLRVGERLLEVRQAAKLSQQAVATSAGIDRSHLANLEAGSRTCTVKVLGDLARALAVQPEDLLRSGSPARSAKATPEEKLGHLVATLSMGCEAHEIRQFEKLTRAFFGAAQRRKRSPRKQ